MSYRRVADAVMRAADLSGTGTPRVLLYAPQADGNPFQALLYSGLWKAGIVPVGCAGIGSLRAAEVALSAGGSAAAHLHWTSSLAANADSASDFRTRAREYLDVLGDLASIRVPVIWTIHNPIEHDSPFVAEEVEFRSQLAQAVDTIHVMSSAALEDLQGYFEIPSEKVVVVPHPSYVGAYPDFVGKQASKNAFGFELEDLVVGVVGALRPYKRIGMLNSAARRASEDRPVRILCAGDLNGHPTVRAEADALRADPWAVLEFRKLSDREISQAVAACDIVWCAYDSPLTSGVSLLAMSLGRPVLLPDRAVSRELAGDAGIYVDLADQDGLAHRLASLDLADLERRGGIARKRAEEFTHEKVGAAFAAAISHLF